MSKLTKSFFLEESINAMKRTPLLTKGKLCSTSLLFDFVLWQGLQHKFRIKVLILRKHHLITFHLGIKFIGGGRLISSLMNFNHNCVLKNINKVI